ncbi:MAG TPA: VTT domain-containing protein [Candidatus Nanoarchaeia archaeon]|nr:VTT domain-containing protein [Candidatus Nanoarchaeia archaeon]
MILDWIQAIYNIEGLIAWGGLAIICLIVFVETGLFFGFFLPGDSLLITAGVLSAAGLLNVWHLLIFVSLSAIAGDQIGYYIGHKMGKMLFKKKDSLIFHPEHLARAKAFYDKHGPKTIVIARFVPIVRTFVPPIAGAANMQYKTFVTYNVLGGMLWVFSTTLGGYFLGSLIPNLERYLYIIIATIIILSFVPILIEIYKHRKKKE